MPVLELSLRHVAPRTSRLVVQAAEETGKVRAGHVGHVYRFRRAQKAPTFLDKMMCITMWKE